MSFDRERQAGAGCPIATPDARGAGALDAAALTPAVKAMLTGNMGLEPGEKVLVLTDVPSPDEVARLDARSLDDFLGRVAFARMVATVAAREFPEAAVEFAPFASTGQDGSEVPVETAAKMKAANVVLALTTHSLTHTRATGGAAAAGARIASMPGITAEMFLEAGPMAVDWAAVETETKALADLITVASRARVTCPAGTDLSFSVEGRPGGSDDGVLSKLGAIGNLPAGEAFTAPVEGTAEGRLHVRRGWYPGLSEDMTLVFAGGEVVSLVGGGEVGRWLAGLLELPHGGLAAPGRGTGGKAAGTAGGTAPSLLVRSRRNCAELGVGTNPNARRPDNVLEAEKIRGTIHIAIGDSSHLGGQTESDLHLDFVIPEAGLYLDGRAVMVGGKMVGG